MDATFLAKIKSDYPELRFTRGRKFAFRPPKTIVIPSEEDTFDSLRLLHELGHALIGLWNFDTEIERLKIEVLAWEKAKELAPLYGVDIDLDLIEGELDTYRNWLHQKSRCPLCELTRFQTPDGAFHCPRCDFY